MHILGLTDDPSFPALRKNEGSTYGANNLSSNMFTVNIQKLSSILGEAACISVQPAM